MVLYRVGLPDDVDIVVRDKFIVDELFPLCIKKVSEDQYSLLFDAEQSSTETHLFLQCLFNYDKNDQHYLFNHPLDVTNIQKNPDRLKFYNEKIDSIKGNIFNTDFDMWEDEEKKMYFHAYAVKSITVKNSISNDSKASLIDLYISRDNFIRMNLFMTRFLNRDNSAIEVFANKKLKNISFLTIKNVYLNGSAENKTTGLVYSSYTLGTGPTRYRMNFVTPIKKGGVLVNRMLPETYNTLYRDDYLITDIIMDNHQDRIFVLYEQRSSINRSYLGTMALILEKDVYDHTNFVEIYKIYENDSKKKSKLILT